MAVVQKNLTELGVGDEEFDAAVDEAMEDVRRRCYITVRESATGRERVG